MKMVMVLEILSSQRSLVRLLKTKFPMEMIVMTKMLELIPLLQNNVMM